MKKQIKSFQVDHDFIIPGMYVSRIDGDVITYDLRTRKPNCDSYMDSVTMHTMEHMFATYIRFSEKGNNIIYFGPMGCRTGFYLLVKNMTDQEVLDLTKDTLKQIINHEGEVFGNSRKECGNYKELNLESAKNEARKYLKALENWNDFSYRGE
jgi:S-ribosylhomocysteine lyase